MRPCPGSMRRIRHSRLRIVVAIFPQFKPSKENTWYNNAAHGATSFSSGIHVHHHLIFCHRRWRESWHQWRRDCTRSQLWREGYRLPTRQRAKLSVIERVKSLLYGRTSRSVFFIALVYYSLHRFTLCRPKQLAEKCNSTMHFFFKPFLLTQKSW